MKNSLVRWIVVLICCAITLEHKFDKHFRQFSKSLIPEGLVIPSGFEKKFYYYPSDLLILFLFLFCLWRWKDNIFDFFSHRGVPFLLIIPLFGAMSIYCSSLWYYPLSYLRLWHLATGFILFTALVSLDKEERDAIGKWTITALIATGALQAVTAICQYAVQHSLGLNWLGELPFTSHSNECCFGSDQGKWIFDHWMGIPLKIQLVQRVMGTFSHPNVLAGFLSVTLFLTLFAFTKKTGRIKLFLALLFSIQMFALIITYSRAGFFAFLLESIVWMFLTIRAKKRLPLLSIFALLIATCTIIWSIVGKQLIIRGGFFNQTALSMESDRLRFAYQKAAFKMIEALPITGVGYGQFTYHLRGYLEPGYDPEKLKSAVHNIYLLLASEMGIFPLLSFLSFIALLFWRFVKSIKTESNRLFFSILFGLLFIGCCDYYLLLFQEGRILFFLIASFLALHLDWKRAPQYSNMVQA